MQIRTLVKEQFLPGLAHEEVFEFFKKPENLARITPPSLGFQILTPSPVKMEKGRVIDYRIKVLGITQRWRSLITDYEPPHHFVDQQLTGPYSFWHHTHAFESKDGGTWMKDEVRYALPLGFLGEIAAKLFVEKQLSEIFNYRAQVITEVFKK